MGYERATGYESLIATEVGADMYGVNTACCIRIPFESEDDPCNYGTMTLNVRYDDGFVAYLNGVEIARALFTGVPQWDSHAESGHEAQGLDSYDVSIYRGLLRRGENLLAIQGMNASSTSSDFLISVELIAGRPAALDEQVLPATGRYEGPIVLPSSACVKSRAWAAGGWSAMNEAVFAVGPVAESLRISEILYHPADTGDPNDPNTEFIELTHVGDEPIHLNLVRLVEGVDFVFPDITLAPGDCVLVVKDLAAFEARYGPGLPIAGRYEGNLSNAGERIRLQDAAGRTIHDFRFQDGWYEATDGTGYSLTVVDPATMDPMSLGDEAAWRPSESVGGSPGSVDAR